MIVPARIRKSFLSLTGQPLEDLRRKVDEENTKLEEWQRQIDRERKSQHICSARFCRLLMSDVT
jgi:hypothetical protein